MGKWDKGPLDYIDVAARIVEFRAKHPEGSLSSIAPTGEVQRPFLMEIGGATFLAYCAFAYRSPDDRNPGVGWAYEPVPGKTNFTRDSELQNAETAAWGRAMVAALAVDTKKGVASAEEVRNRQTVGNEPSGQQPRATPEQWLAVTEGIAKAKDLDALKKVWEAAQAGEYSHKWGPDGRSVSQAVNEAKKAFAGAVQ
jgi:hypothetical protein